MKKRKQLSYFLDSRTPEERVNEPEFTTESSSHEDAYDIGFHLGVRRTLEYLTKYGIIDSDIIALTLEQKYYKDIKKLDE